jgi:hypothetical protein
LEFVGKVVCVVASRLFLVVAAAVGKVCHRLLELVRRGQAELITIEVCSHLGRKTSLMMMSRVMKGDGIGRCARVWWMPVSSSL